MDGEEEEFFDDFGTPPIPEAQLDEMLAEARATKNTALRQLVLQLRTLRFAANLVLQHIDQSGELTSREEPLKLLRFLVPPTRQA